MHARIGLSHTSASTGGTPAGGRREALYLAGQDHRTGRCRHRRWYALSCDRPGWWPSAVGGGPTTVLEGMGLARRVSADSLGGASGLSSVLRGMQKMADRQRTLAASGVLRSDERLPIQALDHRVLVHVEGRILVHGEEESGRSYMMLESTDARVYAIKHTRQMQEMRQAGGLRVNTFVRLRRVFAAGRPRIEVEELGTAETFWKTEAICGKRPSRSA